MTGQNFETTMRRLAYDQTDGDSPGVVFLAGFGSNKSGNKALFLEDWAKRSGRAFLRFDYSGHGESSGNIADLGVSDWARDAEAIVMSMTVGKQVLVGSSMGGWIALLLAQRIPERIAGLVLVAAAPDFTEAKYANVLTEAERVTLLRDGFVKVPSEYSEEPQHITRHLIEDGRQNLIFSKPLRLPFPTRILHGTGDTTIPVDTANRLYDHAEGSDIQLNLVAGADHRFSTPDCLELIREAVEDVLANTTSIQPPP